MSQTPPDASIGNSIAELVEKLTQLNATLDNGNIAVAVQVCRRVKDVLDLGVDGDWALYTNNIIGPGLRRMIAATTSIERLPSESAYSHLITSSAELLATLPALHEVVMLASTEAVSTVVVAAQALEERLQNARANRPGEVRQPRQTPRAHR